jgi:RecA/RadA recombinase
MAKAKVAKKATPTKAPASKKTKKTTSAPALVVSSPSPDSFERASAQAQESLSANQTFTRSGDLSHAEKMRILNGMRQKNPDLFVSAEDLSSPYMLRRPTGVIELDVTLAGGFPAGGSSMLSGPYNSGKSWLLWRMFAMQQRIYGHEFIGAIAHAEGAIDYEHVRRCGCFIAVPDDVINGWNELRFQRGLPELTSQEVDYWKMQIGHLETVQGDTGEQILTGVLNLNEKGVCNIVAIDSITSLQSMKDADKDMDEESKRAAHAQMMKQFWLRYVPQTRRGKNHTTVMMVQQVVQRDKSNAGYAAKYLSDWEVRGGESSKHYKLIDLVVSSGAKIRDTEKNVIGKEVNYHTLKGKAGVHDNVNGSFSYYYHLNGTDVYGDLIGAAIRRGLLMQYGAQLVFMSAQTRDALDDVRYKNDGEVKERLIHDVAFEFAVRREILAASGIQCLYR